MVQKRQPLHQQKKLSLLRLLQHQKKEAPVTASIPAGVEIVTMPRLSDTMERGTVASWLKKVGDTVEEGDILAEIETDKATMEFRSFYSGTLLHIGIDQGGSAPVDAVLAIMGPAGTDVSSVLTSATAQGPCRWLLTKR